jgi:hypothetical protein
MKYDDEYDFHANGGSNEPEGGLFVVIAIVIILAVIVCKRLHS